MYNFFLFSPLPTDPPLCSVLHYCVLSIVISLVVAMAVSGFVSLAGRLMVVWVELGVIGSHLGVVGAWLSGWGFVVMLIVEFMCDTFAWGQGGCANSKGLIFWDFK